MSEKHDCGCGRRIDSCPSEVSRRRFLQTLGVGAVGASLGGILGQAEAFAGPLMPPRALASLPLKRFPLTAPRVYRGEFLDAVAMPVGGIGTGTIWLDGEGKLGVWQIFNNSGEPRIPDSFFAVRAQPDREDPVARILQTVPEYGFKPCEELSFEGGYPIARLDLEDDTLPVDVRMEVFNPMIPTDAANSAIPCAVFRLTARNTHSKPVTVSLLGALQNAVGSRGSGGISGVEFADYGSNENSLARGDGLTMADLTRRVSPPPPGLLYLRDNGKRIDDAPPMLWIDELSGLTEMAQGSETATQAVLRMADMAANGGTIVVGEAKPEFFEALDAVREQMAGWDQLEVFEDWEDGDYEGWTKTGEAFGDAPHTGTTPGQQAVGGYMGSRLVNTFMPNDRPRGRLVSKPFTIKRKHIGFLIGGGSHEGETCMNLTVDGETVRTTIGKNVERLDAVSWDVSDLIGKEARLEIVDDNSGGWGHINVDHIVFADAPPEDLLAMRGPIQLLAQELLFGASSSIQYNDGQLGKAWILLGSPDPITWEQAEEFYFYALGRARKESETLVSDDAGHGTMALTASVGNATCNLDWTDADALAAEFTESGELSGPESAGPTAAGRTTNSALCMRFRLHPGQERTETFIISWHFPNVERFGHRGNQYSRRFADAADVARYVRENLDTLWDRTKLYQETVYESNLPEEFIDAMTSQSVIFRGPTAWWDEDGYFAGFEGAYGCCPLNCTHVWNYAQTHARLFPEIDRNQRRSDLITYLYPTGETSHRQHGKYGAFIDGHCATIEAALRAHQMSPDNDFIQDVYPNLVKAVDWLIERIDPARDGVPQGGQPNTYDTEVSGANTFIGSQYLSALACAEELADAMDDDESVVRWHAIRASGMEKQDADLWNGEYYYQIPEESLRDYNTGCHADQLLGQWWAHQLDIGYLYPKDRVRVALGSIGRYNFRERFEGFKQQPRPYVIDEEGGLLMCTWPKGGRPDPFILYADEVWTGIEYSTAGLMIYEGMIGEARKIVKMARSRYDGKTRDGLNSGPGGNPFNELECGKFYARAMSSWSLLLASQGFVMDGPAGVIGFKPRWQPEDHRSFFTAPEGWGLFVQRVDGNRQTSEIHVRHGSVEVEEIVLETPQAAPTGAAQVTLNGTRVNVNSVGRTGTEVRVSLGDRITVAEGAVLAVEL